MKIVYDIVLFLKAQSKDRLIWRVQSHFPPSTCGSPI